MRGISTQNLVSWVRRRLSDEAGFALPTVLAVIVASFALATAAALAAVTSLQGTNRESDSKAALAAADAGVNQALVRQNLIAGNNPSTSACLYQGAGDILYPSGIQADGWCAPVSGSVNGSTYSYRTRPNTDNTFDVVATGSAKEVDRRLFVSAVNSGGSGVFADASLLGLESVDLDSNVDLFTGVASNGTVDLANRTNTQLCGSASVGLSGDFVVQGEVQTGTTHSAFGNDRDCSESSYPSTKAPLSLPAVQQGDVATNNDNCRITAAFGEDFCPSPNQGDVDTISGRTNRVDWDPATRELRVKSNTDLTIGGANYSFCKLTLDSNVDLYVAAGSTVRFFFDAPENCPGVDFDASGDPDDPIEQLDLSSNSHLKPTSTNPTNLAMLFVGSISEPQLTTEIALNSNLELTNSCQNQFIIYAPKADITVSSNNGTRTPLCGALAGKTLDIKANVDFITSESIKAFEVPGAGPHYTVNRFIECSSTPGSTVASNC